MPVALFVLQRIRAYAILNVYRELLMPTPLYMSLVPDIIHICKELFVPTVLSVPSANYSYN